ncbi:hypothetical protein Fmac_023827 [Flemingia macrophylla]|uniref:Uncharacterized protein n=1 Tax=Flemingia macrophylla TaxID=520843 RepID=A0ABD1LMN6_9FABA
MLESEVKGASCVDGSLERETQVVPRPRVRPASRESREGNPSDAEADGFICNGCITLFRSPEKKDLLLHLLQWMPGKGYVVDPSTRNLILKNSQLFGRQLIAEVLSKQQVKVKTPNID